MSFTYDLSTNIGKIRLLIPDNVESFKIFDDAEIAHFFESEGSSVKRGAAAALEVLGSSELMIQKVQTTKDIKTDGAALMKAYLMRAAGLRAQADTDDANGDGTPDGSGSVRFRRRRGYGFDDCETELSCSRRYCR